jgi:tetratricopeptide (TPR) repeat protein
VRVIPKRSNLVTLSAGLALAAGSLGVLAVRWGQGAPPEPVRDEAQIREQNFMFYERRLRRDPTSAFDRAQLAALHLQRGRETGDPEDVLRAEVLSRGSLAERDTRNARGYSTLISALMTQHRFAEARAVAERLVALDTANVSARAVLGEIHMELGEYAAARGIFGALYARRSNLAVAPRLARWLELQGQIEAARRLLTNARDTAVTRPKMPGEQVAWFHLRVGDLELHGGHLGAARSAFRAGLAVAPHDARLLAAMARLEAARGRWRRAVELGERAIAIAPDPATLGLIGDGYAALGDSARAEEYFHTMEVVTLAQPGGFHRAWNLFLLDHRRRVPEVLAQVREEIHTRRDIYGWDLLAWALHRAGRDREALPAMAQALALGTEDALLFYHMGTIQRALGHRVAARRYLARALAVNPYFHPKQARDARAALEAL